MLEIEEDGFLFFNDLFGLNMDEEGEQDSEMQPNFQQLDSVYL